MGCASGTFWALGHVVPTEHPRKHSAHSTTRSANDRKGHRNGQVCNPRPPHGRTTKSQTGVCPSNPPRQPYQNRWVDSNAGHTTSTWWCGRPGTPHDAPDDTARVWDNPTATPARARTPQPRQYMDAKPQGSSWALEQNPSVLGTRAVSLRQNTRSSASDHSNDGPQSSHKAESQHLLPKPHWPPSTCRTPYDANI